MIAEEKFGNKLSDNLGFPKTEQPKAKFLKVKT
jgi:hypothetical protein